MLEIASGIILAVVILAMFSEWTRRSRERRRHNAEAEARFASMLNWPRH